jgi:hypothetical protein
VRVLRWLGSVIAGGFTWWLITLGGGVIVSAVVASVSNARQPWVSVLAVGVFMTTTGLLIGLIALLRPYVPRRLRRALRPAQSRPAYLPDFMTPQGQITSLIEEGRALRRIIPPPATGGREGLIQALSGANVNYPARVYEWEMRAWRLLGTPGLSRWRGLFPQPETRQLAGLGDHVAERVQQLEVILARL